MGDGFYSDEAASAVRVLERAAALTKGPARQAAVEAAEDVRALDARLRRVHELMRDEAMAADRARLELERERVDRFVEGYSEGFRAGARAR